MLTTEAKLNIIKEYATHEGDTGSAEVQVAILTARTSVPSSVVMALVNPPCSTPLLAYFQWMRELSKSVMWT